MLTGIKNRAKVHKILKPKAIREIVRKEISGMGEGVKISKPPRNAPNNNILNSSSFTPTIL